MAQPSCFTRPPGDESFLPATLESVRRCPARPDYIELGFATPEGGWTWCFPNRADRRNRPAGPIALTVGPYGVQARLIHSGSLGPALQSSSALPLIRSGADVYLARELVPRRPLNGSGQRTTGTG